MRSFVALFLLTGPLLSFAQDQPAGLVNPFIGTGGHGHTFPGATLPFGMVQLSPDTRTDGSWDGCGGYHYDDSLIYGFSHTHLSGTGCSDYGDIMLMPCRGRGTFDPVEYASPFQHAKESASAGYYSVHLDKPDVLAELTATERTGFHQYTFHKTGEMSIVLDMRHRDKLLADSISIEGRRIITGYRRSEAWARDQLVYFRIEFSKEFASFDTLSANGMTAAVLFHYKVKKGEKLLVKVSLSSVDVHGARANMQSENPGWDFQEVRTIARETWNRELSKIEVEGGTREQRVIFYTALYHCFIQPNLYSDVDGRYRGRDFQVHKAEGFRYYTVFSLWDTYRAAHPLYNLLQPERNTDFIRTFLEQYRQSGRLPIWELSSNETNCMIGYHAASVIADAMARGNTNFDVDLAKEAVLNNRNMQSFGIPVFRANGYLSADDEAESVSKTLEYAYDDWCISKILEAGTSKNEKDLQAILRGASGWQHLLNRKTGFMQPRKNGGWYAPFDPREVNNHFTEANSWQYSFYVPHDIPGLVAAHGGNLAFEHKLDSLFTADSKTTGRDQADISGMIGQYAHGNEPSHHMAYLYNFIGRPDKTSFYVKRIMDDMYANRPDGLSGNEDCGQMSAWYVFSALGFYPVCPGKNEYIQGTASIFKGIKILGKPLESLKLNIKAYDLEPMPWRSTSAPVLEAAGQTFYDSLTVTISANGNEGDLFYRFTDGPDTSFQAYKSPIKLTRSAHLEAIVRQKGSGPQPSPCKGYFHRIPHRWGISIRSVYNRQYHAGGPQGLIDGLRGETDWRKGLWQGYQGQDFEAVVDLKEVRRVESVTAGFLQDTRSWILMPVSMEVSVSEDGVSYKSAGSVKSVIQDNQMDPLIQDLKISVNSEKVRYVKVRAVNYGKLPDWHPGAGGDAFIFIDEIGVK